MCMVKPFGLKKSDAPGSLKVLFVNVNEDDTSFLTKEVLIKVVHASSSSSLEAQLEQDRFDALVMNMAGSDSEKIRQLKKSHGTAVFLLADSFDLSKAIEIIKQGADGFLLRGISSPASFVGLTNSSNCCMRD